MDRRAELLEVIRSVRNRWRQRLIVRGAVLVVGGTLVALFLSASSLQALRFSPGAIIAFRLIAFAIFGSLVYQFLVRPIRRRVTDTQVAMYLEEKDPTLEAAILSAIEATSGSSRPSISAGTPWRAITSIARPSSATRSRSAASPSRPCCSSSSARRTCGRASRRCSS
jgi:membrane protein implicated in regulation of membrane protease activity